MYCTVTILSFSRPFVPIFWLLQPTDPPPLASWVSFVSRVREQNRTASTHEEKRIVRVSRGVDGSRARQMRQRVEEEPNAPPVKPSAQGHGHHFWDALEMTMMGQECDIGCPRKAKKGHSRDEGHMTLDVNMSESACIGDPVHPMSDEAQSDAADQASQRGHELICGVSLTSALARGLFELCLRVQLRLTSTASASCCRCSCRCSCRCPNRICWINVFRSAHAKTRQSQPLAYCLPCSRKNPRHPRPGQARLNVTRSKWAKGNQTDPRRHPSPPRCPFPPLAFITPPRTSYHIERHPASRLCCLVAYRPLPRRSFSHHQHLCSSLANFT